MPFDVDKSVFLHDFAVLDALQNPTIPPYLSLSGANPGARDGGEIRHRELGRAHVPNLIVSPDVSRGAR